MHCNYVYTTSIQCTFANEFSLAGVTEATIDFPDYKSYG